MSNRSLYAIHFSAKVQYGTWHAEDDLEITGYGPSKNQVFFVSAPSEEYVKTWWGHTIRCWPAEHETKLIKIENMGQLTTITIT